MSWKFWKKEQDFSFPKELGLKDNTGLDLSTHFDSTLAPPISPSSGFPPSAPAYPPANSFPSTFAQQSAGFSPAPAQPQLQTVDDNPAIQKDLEIIAAKLDTIRAQLETLNAKLSNMENPRKPW